MTSALPALSGCWISEKLKQNTLDVARESERGIVDIQTLKKANENLISTMSEAVRIQREGRRRRQEAEAELERLEGDIRHALLENPQEMEGK